jgi:hypothetical protein
MIDDLIDLTGLAAADIAIDKAARSDGGYAL